MYADTITDSMAKAIDETNRRRAKQVAYNTDHGVDPKPLRKRIADITDLLAREDADTEELHRRRRPPAVPREGAGARDVVQGQRDRRRRPAWGPAGGRPGRPDPAADRPDAPRGRASCSSSSRPGFRDEIGELKKELRGMRAAGTA